MKFLILAFCVACAYGAAIEQTAQILRSNFDESPDGSYQWAFESDNGISAQAAGTLQQFSKDEAAVVQSGSNQYTAPNGEVIKTEYTADENGYHPQGAHLPTPPPTEALPEHVVRSLAYIAAHPYTEKN